MNRSLPNSKTVFLLTTFMLFATVGFSQTALPGSDCKPNVEKNSILNAVQVDGKLRLGELYLECYPLPAKRTAGYIFEPYQGTKFTTNLKNSNGTLVNSFVWYGKEYFGKVRLTNYEIVGGQNALKELAAGDYALEFAIDGKVFQTFRFSIITKKSNDAYRPGTIYLLEGAWRDEAVLTSPTVENVMCFNFRFRAPFELAEFKPVSVPFELTMIRDRDKALVGESSGKLSLNPVFSNYRRCFERPNRAATKDNSTLNLKEIAAADGNYTINLSVDGKLYANYKLNVNNGRINGKELPQRMIRLTLASNILRK